MREQVDKFRSWSRQIAVGDVLSKKDIVGIRKLADEMDEELAKPAAKTEDVDKDGKPVEAPGFWDE